VSDTGQTRPGLPDTCRAAMDGERLPDKVGHTFLLLVTDAEGWPHMAMLSAGEVFAPDADHIRIALHGTSRTSRALRDSRRAVLVTVVAQQAHRIRLDVAVAAEPTPDDGLRYFEAAVVEARIDAVGYATVVDGIRYELTRPETVLPRWEATVDRLRHLGCTPVT
jgi:hypothetical protein